MSSHIALFFRRDLLCLTALFAAPVLWSAPQIRCDSANGGLTLPKGFCAAVVADAVGPARHLTVASNGDVYVALMGRHEHGGVMALRDVDGDGKFETQEHFGSDSATGI